MAITNGGNFKVGDWVYGQLGKSFTFHPIIFLLLLFLRRIVSIQTDRTPRGL